MNVKDLDWNLPAASQLPRLGALCWLRPSSRKMILTVTSFINEVTYGFPLQTKDAVYLIVATDEPGPD